MANQVDGVVSRWVVRAEEQVAPFGFHSDYGEMVVPVPAGAMLEVEIDNPMAYPQQLASLI